MLITWPGLIKVPRMLIDKAEAETEERKVHISKTTVSGQTEGKLVFQVDLTWSIISFL